jgi:hypothetical protein
MSAPSLSDFRQTFPEFGDLTIYPDASVTLWLGFATQMVNETRWGSLYNLGVYLVIAHNLILAARDQASADAGGIAGEMTGPVSSKGVDKVSVSYDTGSATMQGAGAWNLSTYGVRYLQLSRMFGAGGMQL